MNTIRIIANLDQMYLLEVTDFCVAIDLKEIGIKHKLIYQEGFYFNTITNDLEVTSCKKSQYAFIPMSACDKVYFLIKTNDHLIVDDRSEESEKVVRALIAILLRSLRVKIAERWLFKWLGDVEISTRYLSSYGPSQMRELDDALLLQFLGLKECYAKGRSVGFLPTGYGYSVLDLLSDLKDRGSIIDVPYLVATYNRISPKTVYPHLVSITNDPDAYDSMKVTDFTWNIERANLSARIRVPIVVTDPKSSVSAKTFMTRNYSIIKDGLLNISTLKIKVGDEQHWWLNHLKHKRINVTYSSEGWIIFDLTSIPIINHKYLKSLSSEVLAHEYCNLLSNKMIYSYLKSLPRSKSKSEHKYSYEEYRLLKSLSIDPYNGYQPHTDKVSEDEYESPVVTISVKGLSSLPSPSKVSSKLINQEKLTDAETCYDSVIKEFLIANSHRFDDDNTIKDFLKYFKNRIKQSSSIIGSKLFSMIISHKWLYRLSNYDPITIPIHFYGNRRVTIKYGIKSIKK